ncbi:MAG TPA: CHAT domain-containing tetratricopeptide repeat protein [Pyrinomonadaceae bacterium]
MVLTITIRSSAFAEPVAKPFVQPTPAQDSKQTDVRELKVGEPIERELSGGEVHSYRITLTAGQYLKALVEQKGIDVVVRLLGPNSKEITKVDNPTGTQWPELVPLVAEVTGEYRLEVKPLDDTTAAGKYEIKVEELREATARDQERTVAERTLAEAEALVSLQRTAESLPKALGKYKEALSLWRKVGDHQREALTLNRIGAIYEQLAEFQQALEYYNQALPLRRAVGDRQGEATTVHNIGAIYWRLGESLKALEYYNQALLIRRAVGDRQDLAFSFNVIGLAYNDLGKFPEALDYYTRSLALFSEMGHRRGEANLLANIGTTQQNLGNWQKALEYYGQALSLARPLKIRRLEANMLNSIGVVYWQLGESQKALEYYDQALPLRAASGDRIGEFRTLHTIGTAHKSLGDLPTALEFLDRALALARAVGDRRSEASTLREIGSVYESSGERQKATDLYNQALVLHRAVADRLGEAITISNIGVSYSSLGKPEKALEYLRQALMLHRAVGDRDGEASTLRRIAIVERDRGRLVEARTQIEGAIKIVESTRSQFVNQQLRTSFSVSRQDYYEFYINLLMRMHRIQPFAGHATIALHANERARARSLLEILTESRADIRQGVDAGLLERERSLQQQLNAKSERLTRLLGGKHTEEQEETARKEVETLLADYQDVQAQIRSKSPRFAALTQPQPLSSKEIQQSLDKDTLLLEYALGNERSYLWAVTPTSIKCFELPKRAEIEIAARRVYDLIVTRTDKLDPEALNNLSQILLGPVAQQLGGKRLLVVAQGALQYVPFGALPAPVSKLSKRTSSQPLVVNHEIVSLPSASVLAVLRKEFSKRTAAPGNVAVLADPVFAKDDQRVMSGIKTQQSESGSAKKDGLSSLPSDVQRSASDLNLTSFDRLPLSRIEADIITTMVPKTKAMQALDFAASRSTATSVELGRYQIVHFATHSLLNNQHPELSGIVLSLVDQQGVSQDGFLRLHDIYNLKLQADLVVLSACQTALGKEIKGEGLVGLTRGFMYAGTPRVVASLWKVSDKATAELMKRFYEKMLKGGLKPSAALRAAQVSMLKERQWSAPYYWAGFVLQGEWK